MGTHAPCIGAKCNAHEILVGKPEGETSWRKWVDNNKMGLGEIGWGGMDWNNLAQDSDQLRALVNTTMNLWVP
jgi:hypothetical protein